MKFALSSQFDFKLFESGAIDREDKGCGRENKLFTSVWQLKIFSLLHSRPHTQCRPPLKIPPPQVNTFLNNKCNSRYCPKAQCLSCKIFRNCSHSKVWLHHLRSLTL
mmetsp:Transcript_1164/g.4016  ORF Transcript_1164/g.4016 Transcript_1164/m.4016 type:complete len:107 (-) Transcript_1164:782-1102(-)